MRSVERLFGIKESKKCGIHENLDQRTLKAGGRNFFTTSARWCFYGEDVRRRDAIMSDEIIHLDGDEHRFTFDIGSDYYQHVVTDGK